VRNANFREAVYKVRRLSAQPNVMPDLLGHGESGTDVVSVIALTVDVNAADQKPGDQRHDFHAPILALAI